MLRQYIKVIKEKLSSQPVLGYGWHTVVVYGCSSTPRVGLKMTVDRWNMVQTWATIMQASGWLH